MPNEHPDFDLPTPTGPVEPVTPATGDRPRAGVAGPGNLPGPATTVPVDGLPGAPLFPDLLRALTDDEWAQLCSSVEKSGIISPVVLSDAGELIDGWHRLKAAREKGLAEVPAVTVVGLTAEGKRNLALTLNVARRQLTPAEVRAAIERKVVESPWLSNRKIAVEVSRAVRRRVDDQLVGQDRDRLEADETVPRLEKRVGRDGRVRPARRAASGPRVTSASLDPKPAGRGTGSTPAVGEPPPPAAAGSMRRAVRPAPAPPDGGDGRGAGFGRVGADDEPDDGQLFEDDPIDVTDELGPATGSEAIDRPPPAAPAQAARPAGRTAPQPAEAEGDVSAEVWDAFTALAGRAREAAAELDRIAAGGRGPRKRGKSSCVRATRLVSLEVEVLDEPVEVGLGQEGVEPVVEGVAGGPGQVGGGDEQPALVRCRAATQCHDCDLRGGIPPSTRTEGQ